MVHLWLGARNVLTALPKITRSRPRVYPPEPENRRTGPKGDLSGSAPVSRHRSGFRRDGITTASGDTGSPGSSTIEIIECQHRAKASEPDMKYMAPPTSE